MSSDMPTSAEMLALANRLHRYAFNVDAGSPAEYAMRQGSSALRALAASREAKAGDGEPVKLEVAQEALAQALSGVAPGGPTGLSELVDIVAPLLAAARAEGAREMREAGVAKAREIQEAWTAGGKILMGSAARYVAQALAALPLPGPAPGAEEVERCLADEGELLAAARAVLAQWDTPNWKLTEPTAAIMARLRRAADAAGGDMTTLPAGDLPDCIDSDFVVRAGRLELWPEGWTRAAAEQYVREHPAPARRAAPYPGPTAGPWPPLKRALWDVVTAAELNGPRYTSAWALTEALHAAALGALAADPSELAASAREPYVRAIDEALVTRHLGVFEHGDDLREALNRIGSWDSDVGEYHGREEMRSLCSRYLGDLASEHEAAAEGLGEEGEAWHGPAARLLRRAARGLGKLPLLGREAEKRIEETP